MIYIFSSKKNLKAQPRSRIEIRRLAEEIKESLNLNLDDKINIIEVFEHLALLLGYEYEIVCDNEMRNNYGETDLSNKVIRIRESVYIGATNGIPRDRFTIAHEIGHFILHCNGYSLCRTDKEVRPFEDPEWQANTFAAEFLVATSKIKGYSINRVSSIYGVSKEVAAIQLKNI